MEAYVREKSIPETIMYASSSAVSVGEVIYVAGLGVLRAMEAGDAAESICYAVKGVFNFPIYTAVTVAQGKACYWDVSENKVILTGMAEADFFLGFAVSAGTAAGGYVDVEISNAANAPAALGNISVMDASGKFKASYATIDLACAALANSDILRLKAGEYTLTAAINITATDVQIIGERGVRIICAVGADYGFKTVFGAISSTKGITFADFEISAGDDATQQAFRVENTSATGRINVYINNVDFESDDGDSIHVDHASTSASIRLYVNGCTSIEGPVNFTVGHSDDRIRFTDCQLLGGLVTGSSATVMEIALRNCIVLHLGVTGGASAQLLYVMDCYTVTGGNPEVYAAFDADDSAGTHTESLRFPQS